MANTTNFGWETPDDTDLVKDGAAAMRTLGSAIDTSLVDLKGGTTGQVLSKTTNTDLDFTWVTSDDANAIQNAIVDAKGDLIAASDADTPARLAVGTNGYVLIADSTQTTGLKWGIDPTNDVITTAGDLLYGTAADTVARLGIGTAGQVLTVNSGATAPEWAAPAGGGGMTLLASGSIAASATGFDLTSISGSYNELWLYITDLSANATGGVGYGANLTLNNDTGANYSTTGSKGGSVLNVANATYGFILCAMEDNTNDHSVIVRIPNYADTTSSKIVHAIGHDFSTNTPRNTIGVWSATPAAIDRLTLKISTGAFDNGSYKLYGVK